MRRRWSKLDGLLRALREDSEDARRRALEEIGRLISSRRSRPAARQLDQTFAAMAALLRSDADPAVRYEAAYQLTHWLEGRAAAVLLTVLDDPGEPPRLRGQAAEGVGMILDPALSRRRSSGLRARAIPALRRGLADAAPEVRFWCLYALGSMRAVEARADIERLAATDDAPCPSWWRVSEEAADVLACWADGHWPDRVPGAP